MRIRVDVRLLHHILGFVFVSHDRPCRPVDALVVSAHQHLEERCLTLADTADDLLVGQRGPPAEDRSSRSMHLVHSIDYRVAAPEKVTRRAAFTSCESRAGFRKLAARSHPRFSKVSSPAGKS
jgi:hypothetical protein